MDLFLTALIVLMLFRKNGIHTILFFMGGIFCAFVIQRKKTDCVRLKELMVLLLVGIAMYQCSSLSLRLIFHAEKGSSIEALSVPIQQIARIYTEHKSEISESDRELVTRFIPEEALECYKESLADPVKDEADQMVLEDNLQEYISLYIRLGCAFPGSYTKAFLYNTMGYWYLDDVSHARIYGWGENKRVGGYLATNSIMIDGIDNVVHKSLLPVVESVKRWKIMSVNEKKLYKTVAVLFLLLSLPIVILALYNVPSADDYTFGSFIQNWVAENGYHIWGILRCGVQNMIDYYLHWQGAYSVSFLASFMPEIFGCYWLSAIIIYLMLTGSNIYLFCSLSRCLAGKEAVWAGIFLALVVNISIVQNVPFPVEAFYWFDGAMVYILHHSFYIWMCGVVISYFSSDHRKNNFRSMVILAILTMIVAGGNNVTSFVSVLTYIGFVLLAFCIRRKWGIIFPCVLSVCGFLVSYLSPGTTIRGGSSENYTPILLTIIKCFRWTLRQYLLEWTTAAVLLMLIFLTPLILKIILIFIHNHDFKFPFPGIVAAGGICFLSAMSSPPFYVLGEPGPGRVKNVIYVNYMIILVLVYGYTLGWIAVKERNREIAIKISEIYQNIPFRYSVCMAVFIIGLLSIGNSREYGVSIEALKELASGQASRYYQEALERKALYMDPETQNVEVSPYSVKPYLLFFDDITDDPMNWKNKGISEYYGKETIRLDQYDPDVGYD